MFVLQWSFADCHSIISESKAIGFLCRKWTVAEALFLPGC